MGRVCWGEWERGDSTMENDVTVRGLGEIGEG